MTQQLENAIKKLTKLPEKEQNGMAQWIRADLIQTISGINCLQIPKMN